MRYHLVPTLAILVVVACGKPTSPQNESNLLPTESRSSLDYLRDWNPLPAIPKLEKSGEPAATPSDPLALDIEAEDEDTDQWDEAEKAFLLHALFATMEAARRNAESGHRELAMVLERLRREAAAEKAVKARVTAARAVLLALIYKNCEAQVKKLRKQALDQKKPAPTVTAPKCVEKTRKKLGPRFATMVRNVSRSAKALKQLAEKVKAP